MTLKKEIAKAIRDGEGTVKINDISSLIRWTKNAIGEECDCLVIRFDYMCGIKGGWIRDIESRDVDGIIDEIKRLTTEYFLECSIATTKNIENGYR